MLPPLSRRLKILGLPNAQALAGALFRESFGADVPVPRDNCGLPIPTPPENWRQYVAVYTWPNGAREAVGFVNFIRYGDLYLEGGMCVKSGFYRRMPREHWQACRARGGIAQMMMEEAKRKLNDCIAWFGYCGDPMAMAADLRAGFEPTSRPYIIVQWFRQVDELTREKLIEQVERIGPF